MERTIEYLYKQYYNSQWKKHEAKTTMPRRRFLSFKLKEHYPELPMYLYIKPVLEGITPKDFNKYLLIIDEYNVGVILGEMFSMKNNLHIAPIGNNDLFYQKKSSLFANDYEYLFNGFSKYTKTYTESIEPIIIARKEQ